MKEQGEGEVYFSFSKQTSRVDSGWYKLAAEMSGATYRLLHSGAKPYEIDEGFVGRLKKGDVLVEMVFVDAEQHEIFTYNLKQLQSKNT